MSDADVAFAMTRQRGSFHDTYMKKIGNRDLRSKLPRLLDCLVCIAQPGDPEYFCSCKDNEIAVIDLVTKEKAWFELPADTKPTDVTRMVESTFAASAFRADHSVWVV